MFIEDIIKANLTTIFPGYRVDSSYCIKISRDADILIDDAASSNEIIDASRFPGISGRRLPDRP